MTSGAGGTRLITVHGAPDTYSCADIVANVAWILAAAGEQVLVLEWLPPRATGVDAHLRLCPHGAPDSRPDVAVPDETARRIVDDAFPGSRSTRRPAPRGRWTTYPTGDRGGVLTVGSFAQGSGPDGPRAREVTDLAERITSSGTSFTRVLLHGHQPGDEPAGTRSSVVRVAGGVADADAADKVLRDLAGHGERTTDVVPAIIGSRASESGLDLRILVDWHGGLSSVRLQTAVGIPFVPGHPTGEVLAVHADRTGAAAAAYHELAQRVVGPGVDLPAVSAESSARYRWALREEPDSQIPTYTLRYAPRDRPWADRIARWLRRAGVHTDRHAPGAAPDARTVTVLSQRSTADVTDADPSFVVCTDGSHPTVGLNLSALPRDARRPAVLTRLRMFERPPTPTRPSPAPAPTDELDHGEPPQRDRRFTGRDDLVEKIRDIVAPLDDRAPVHATVYLSGPPGIGKTGLALEYLHRFRDSYGDRVCWLAATDADTLRSGLAGFAQRMRWSGRPDVEKTLTALTAAGRNGKRWLVVLDGAPVENLAPIPGLEQVDTLVTTSVSSGQLPSDATVVVGELPPAERVQLVSTIFRLSGPAVDDHSLGDDEARLIPELVGGHPLPLIIATSWLHGRNRQARRTPARYMPPGTPDRVASPFVEALRRRSLDELGAALEGVATDDVLPYLVKLVCRTLGGSHDPVERLAAHLTSMCAFLAPGGIALELLRSRSLVRRLAGLACNDGLVLLSDEEEIDRVLVAGSRLGLYDLDWQRPATLWMHATVQEAVREVVADRAPLVRATALAALADLVPFDLEDERTRGRMVELQRHFGPSGAATATDPEQALDPYLGSGFVPGTDGWNVRRWVVQNMAFAYLNGHRHGYAAALAVTERVIAAWTALLGSDPGGDPAGDRLLQTLRDRRGALLMAMDKPSDALTVDQQLLADLRRHLGERHPRSLHAAGAVAGDLRLLGHYEEAYTEDLTIWRNTGEALGRDHPECQAAGNNLAISMLLAGRFADARDMQEDLHRRRVAVLGVDSPWTRRSLRRLCSYRSACGDLADASRDLRRLDEDASDPARDEHESLLVRLALAEVDRAAHSAAVPKADVSAAEQLVAEFVEHLGPDHPHTSAARLELAITHHLAGDGDRAVREAHQCRRHLVEQLRTRLPGGMRRHPHLSLLDADLAVFFYSIDDLPRALQLGRTAFDELALRVGKRHPWTLSAMLNHANALARAVDRQQEAEVLLDRVRRLVRTQRLNTGHPLVRGTGPEVLAGSTDPQQSITITLPAL